MPHRKKTMKISLCTDTELLLSQQAYEVYAPCMYRPSFDKYESKMQTYLCDPCVSIYICEDNGTLAGILVTDCSEGICEIVGIAVSEKCRKQGIGRKMIAFAMDDGKTDRLFAQTDDDAVGFYLSCGFTAEKSLVEYPDGIAVRYECCLSR